MTSAGQDLEDPETTFRAKLAIAEQYLDPILAAMRTCPYEDRAKRIASGVGLLMNLELGDDALMVMSSILMERVLHVE